MPSRSAKRKPAKKTYIFLKIVLLVVSIAFMVGVSRFNILPANTSEVCANSISCINDLSGKFEEDARLGVFLNEEITIPSTLANLTEKKPNVLGHTTASKQIYVDLTNQHLYAFEDNKMVFDFPVSTGKWGRTPTGTFTIWVKLKYTRMSGGSREAGTYYNLPNVPYTMFFYNKDVPKTRGFGIHGTYWHDNFGHPMSHGCINMKTEDVAKLYEWADPSTNQHLTYATAENPGTQIIIYGETPIE